MNARPAPDDRPVLFGHEETSGIEIQERFQRPQPFAVMA